MNKTIGKPENLSKRLAPILGGLFSSNSLIKIQS